MRADLEKQYVTVVCFPLQEIFDGGVEADWGREIFHPVLWAQLSAAADDGLVYG